LGENTSHPVEAVVQFAVGDPEKSLRERTLKVKRDLNNMCYLIHMVTHNVLYLKSQMKYIRLLQVL